MRDVDLESLLALDIPAPRPARRAAAKARALHAFKTTHRRGIGATVARYLVRSSAPAWRLVSEIFDNPSWNSQTITTLMWTGLSLVVVCLFTISLLSVLMIVS
ncbi:MAG: hypothetical protein RJS98_16055 [Rhodospirillaceae bacterium]